MNATKMKTGNEGMFQVSMKSRTESALSIRGLFRIVQITFLLFSIHHYNNLAFYFFCTEIVQ